MSATTRHGKKLDTHVVSPCAPAVTWFAIDCKCGWQSPLCTSSAKAQKIYDAHRKRKRSPLGSVV